MNYKFCKERKKHPAEKSLSVFPLIPHKKSTLVGRDDHSDLKRTKSKKINSSHNCQKVRIQVGGVASPTHTRDKKETAEELYQRELFSITRAKLDRAVKHLPVINKTSTVAGPLQLPPIYKSHKKRNETYFIHGKRQLSQEENTKGYKAFVLPVVSRERCACTCAHGDSTDDLANLKLVRMAKLFRPEEMPPLFSIYVRWRNRRNGTMEHNYNSLQEVFQSFGEISKIVFKSRNSAVISYVRVESACTAAKVMQQVGKEMKLHVKWLNEID